MDGRSEEKEHMVKYGAIWEMADYIEKEAAIGALTTLQNKLAKDNPVSVPDPEVAAYNIGLWQGMKWAIRCIGGVHQADVKPVTRSEWVYLGREEVFDISGVRTWGARYQCRNCGFEPIFIEDHGRYDFCPNCGSYNGGGDNG